MEYDNKGFSPTVLFGVFYLNASPIRGTLSLFLKKEKKSANYYIYLEIRTLILIIYIFFLVYLSYVLYFNI